MNQLSLFDAKLSIDDWHRQKLNTVKCPNHGNMLIVEYRQKQNQSPKLLFRCISCNWKKTEKYD